MIRLTCDCCGFSEHFQDGQDAFEQGWDAPPYFTGYVGCNLCPGSYIVLGRTDRHAPLHEKWNREGRPEAFDSERDVVPEDVIPKAQLDALKEAIKEVFG